MNKLLTFSFIGGDLRQLRAMKSLADEGFRVKAYGFLPQHFDGAEQIYSAGSIIDCISGADAVVLPLPYSVESGERRKINTPLWDNTIDADEILNEKPKLLFAGKVDLFLTDRCRDMNIKLFDYAQREDFAVMNAVPTAEGAIELAMANTTHTLHKSRCLIVGYGRIGKALATSLRALGAEVCVTARKFSDLAWIEANGCEGAQTDTLCDIAGDFDVIFNTVPHKVIDFKVLAKTKNDVLIIDLASRPGGVDFEVAQRLGRRVIWALSLPGKCAPDTAGEIIKDTLVNILEELGV